MSSTTLDSYEETAQIELKLKRDQWWSRCETKPTKESRFWREENERETLEPKRPTQRENMGKTKREMD
jgi:hypothetical protein